MLGEASLPVEPQHACALPGSRAITPLSNLPPLAHVTLLSEQSRSSSLQRVAPLSDPRLIAAILWAPGGTGQV